MGAKRTVFLPDPAATDTFACRVGSVLRQGDVLLLSGQIGAGKTHFVRALIKSLLKHDEDVPSPTFTLVQSYETNIGALWHSDLYRLGDPSELEELGLTEAFETAICLIEWPERMDSLPANALTLSFEPEAQGRRVDLDWAHGDWGTRIQACLQDFETGVAH